MLPPSEQTVQIILPGDGDEDCIVLAVQEPTDARRADPEARAAGNRVASLIQRIEKADRKRGKQPMTRVRSHEIRFFPTTVSSDEED